MIIDIKDTGVESYISTVRRLIGDTPRYAYVHTFGCQQNEADSEKIRALACNMGYLPTDRAEDADLIIVNTCAIREHAEMKALSLIGRFKALKKRRPDLIIGVTGCMSAEPHRRDMLKNDFHYVTFTLEPNMLHRIPELVARAMTEGKRSFILGEDAGDVVEGIEPVSSYGHKAWVSVMYGCNNFCSYCIVPYVRGRERSRNSNDILTDCRRLVASGCREITLLGQNVNSYRADLSFPELISRIAELDGDFILRFMTSHPKDTSDELIETMARYGDRIAPYFHLPLQSGSDTVLKAMNRTYSAEKFLSIVKKLREKIPGIALSTDVIVGFPGESDADFRETLRVLREARFDMVYAFVYSRREGTRAASLPWQIDESVKTTRITELLEMQDAISRESNEPYLDRTLRVLTDSSESRGGRTVYTGRTYTNKLVHFTAERVVRPGEFINVKITKAAAYDLVGEAR